MAEKINLTLLQLPVYLIYRILDHSSDVTIFCSMLNVCTRLNKIIETYHRYQVSCLSLHVAYVREKVNAS